MKKKLFLSGGHFIGIDVIYARCFVLFGFVFVTKSRSNFCIFGIVLMIYVEYAAKTDFCNQKFSLYL